MMTVRIAVASVDGTPSTPTLARTAVNAAAPADTNAYSNHVIRHCTSPNRFGTIRRDHALPFTMDGRHETAHVSVRPAVERGRSPDLRNPRRLRPESVRSAGGR